MFEYLKLKLSFRVLEPCCLPEYKGSTFRGFFKTALKRVSCRIPGIRCQSCVWYNHCAYAMVTEYTTNTGENTLQPYTIACSCLKQGAYKTGDTLSIYMLLIGSAIEHIQSILVSYTGWDRLSMEFYKFLVSEKEMQCFCEISDWSTEVKPKGKLRLESVNQIKRNGERELIFIPEKFFSPPLKEQLSCPANVQKGFWQIRVGLVSPLRIIRKIKGNEKKGARKLLVNPEIFNFDIFLRAVLTRYCGFVSHFGDSDIVNDEKTFQNESLALAKTVIIARNDLYMEKVRRYRNNMTQWEHLDGLMGEVIFDNVPGSLLPWIMIGELLQIGKFPTQGYGEYVAEYELIS